MAGRPRTPSNVLDLRGAFKKNPQRKRDEEPEAVGELGDPPEHMEAGPRLMWHELKEAIPQGVATASDRFAFEVLCTLAGAYRESPLTFSADKLMRMEKLWGCFGLDPSSRAKLSVPKKGKKNEFEDF